MTEFTPHMAPAERKSPPGAVKTAAIIQWALLVLALLTLVFALMYSGDSIDAAVAELKRQGASQDLIDGYESSGGFGAVGQIIGVVLAAVYALLGVFNLRGSRGSRVTTWVLSGLFLLCGLGLFGLGLVGGGQVEGVDMDAVATAMSDAVPGWYAAFGTVSGVLQIVGAIAVIVLLALPASNAFFKKEQPRLILPGDTA